MIICFDHKSYLTYFLYYSFEFHFLSHKFGKELLFGYAEAVKALPVTASVCVSWRSLFERQGRIRIVCNRVSNELQQRKMAILFQIYPIFLSLNKNSIHSAIFPFPKVLSRKSMYPSISSLISAKLSASNFLNTFLAMK